MNNLFIDAIDAIDANEPFYVFIYILDNSECFTIKDLIKVFIAQELKRIYKCEIIVYSNKQINNVDYLINENEIEDVNYVKLCDVMRNVSLKDIEPLSISTVYDLSKLFNIACLSIPGYHKSTINTERCFIISDDNNIDFLIELINDSYVIKSNILQQLPEWILNININITQKQLLKIFNKQAFSGGCDTKEEQLLHGANLDVDESFKVICIFSNKSTIDKVRHLYGTDKLEDGEIRLLSGEVKVIASNTLYQFIQFNKLN